MSAPEFVTIKAMEDAYQLKTYAKHELALEQGEGNYVFDSTGRRYLDFYGGHCVTTTGHCHPRVVAAIRNQAEKLIFYSNVVYSSIRAEAARAIIMLAPEGMTQVFFCNSGTEANETAIKAARKYTGRTTIIAMNDGFHGRTYGSMSATGFAKYRIFPPNLPGIRFADFGKLASVQEQYLEAGGDVGAVMLEPIQSMAGVRIAEPAYYRQLREFCDANGVLLVFDEVQTGFARTGANFFAQTIGITPDLITLAKGIASGVPMGAVIFSQAIAEKIGNGEHGSTFGGGPLACAAAKATAEVIAEEHLADNARELGGYLMDTLRKASIPGLVEVRGIGLLIGVEFEGDGKYMVPALLQRGILIGSSEDPHTIRLIPPLTIGRAECDQLVAALGDAATELFS